MQPDGVEVGERKKGGKRVKEESTSAARADLKAEVSCSAGARGGAGLEKSAWEGSASVPAGCAQPGSGDSVR